MSADFPKGRSALFHFMQFNRSTIQHYKQGDSKEVIRRAWLPKHIGAKVLWLECYITLHVFIEKTVEATINGAKGPVTYGYWQKIDSRPLKADKK